MATSRLPTLAVQVATTPPASPPEGSTVRRLTLEEARQLALGNNKALALARLNVMDCLPDVNVIGGYANQTSASYIQDNIGYVGVTATYTFWDWGKRKDVKRQRQTDIALAHQNLQVTMDKVQLEARKAFGSFEHAREAYRLAGEMVQARQEAEKAAAGPAAAQAKAETSKAELEYMKAEISYRVAHAQLAALINQE